jgi:peptidoglycan hydrolase-like protein with peptidoglycan-binding domain
MALRSTLFRDDPKLEAAAVSDPDHITPGATGDHVRKIQQALNQLDGARLSADGIYGRATAAAVLAYKRRRNIVNRSYQSTADDIVGKMTMAALDLQLVVQENAPGTLLPINPRPLSRTVQTGGPILAFKFSGSNVVGGPGTGGSTPGLTDLVPAPVSQQTAIHTNRIATVKAINFAGGVVVCFEPPDQNSPAPRIAKLVNGTNLRTDGKLDNADVIANPEEFRIQSFFACGIVRMQAIGPGSKKSAISEFLVLVDTSSYTDEPVHPVDNTLPSGLVSTFGTPLNPLPGRRINIFGRGETNGFENYSTSIPFCNDSGNNTKPWTNDPRKPSPGIKANEAKNICIRSSPIQQVTIDEIKRIAAPGCRVTVSSPDVTQINKMKAEFLDKGLARKPPLVDGRGQFALSLVFEFN